MYYKLREACFFNAGNFNSEKYSREGELKARIKQELTEGCFGRKISVQLF
jgi:hypothetical protein